MTHSFVNIVAPIKLADVQHLRSQIGDVLGNPAHEKIANAFTLSGNEGIHFASMHALSGSDGKLGYYLLEFTCDGDGDAMIRRLANALQEPLTLLFSSSLDWRQGNDLADYMIRHRVENGYKLFDQAGLNFAGTPGMSVGQIRQEAALRRAVEDMLAGVPRTIRPLDQIYAVREKLKTNEQWKWALERPAPLDKAGRVAVRGLAKIAILAVKFARIFLWPLGISIMAYAMFYGAQQAGMKPALIAAACALLKATLASLILVLLGLALLYILLRRAEESDWISDRTISRDELARILKRENFYTQNHMMSHTVRKAGFMRRCVSKIAFFAIGEFTALNGRPGFLDRIGTIHFARWMTIPGTRDYIFLSNYDGSWESYLEDFITKAHDGLTAAWSCTMGFPYAKNLFQKGATDGERFKRFARHSMTHTPFWYSAYPSISTEQIRSNAKIRRGIALAESDEEATSLLALFGSVARPAEKLESAQIQSLLFGGMGNLPFGKILLVDLADDSKAASQFIRDILPEVAFNDGRKTAKDAVITLALSATALPKLRVSRSAIETFPAAFLDGMTAPGRDRILGDPLPDERAQYWWWKQEKHDLALLAYALTPADLAVLEAKIVKAVQTGGHRIVHEIALAEIKDKKEPFGFEDGISQPLIKGTYKATRTSNKQDPNLVEPGEFILGYPDNRGNMPPVPRMIGRRDPNRILPVGDGGWDFDASIESEARDIGRNGSFLVLRQLEQHVDAFNAYCEQAYEDHKDDFPDPYEPSAELIAAKIVGRWRDGSALTRWPYESASAYRTRNPSNKPLPPDNDFLFGTEDPEGLRCPFGAHIRRTNPRDSQLPGSSDQVDISNRHRIMRVGRLFGSEGANEPRGLMFMCFNGDIERQFEFVQQTWANSGHFHALDSEIDPLIGITKGHGSYTIPTRSGPIRLKKIPDFVTLRGGGYFFVPGKRFAEYLAQG